MFRSFRLAKAYVHSLQNCDQSILTDVEFKEFCESNNGDLRAAILQLQLALSTSKRLWGGSQGSRSRSQNSETLFPECFMRDSSNHLFRTVGRAMFVKRKGAGKIDEGISRPELVIWTPGSEFFYKLLTFSTSPDQITSATPLARTQSTTVFSSDTDYEEPDLPPILQNRGLERQPLQYHPEQIVADSHIDASTLQIFLHENAYMLKVPASKIRESASIAADLAFADALGNSSFMNRDLLQTYSGSISMRSLMFNSVGNISTSGRGMGWFKTPEFFPSLKAVKRNFERFDGLISAEIGGLECGITI